MVLLPLLAKLLPFDVLPSSFSQKSRDAARKEKATAPGRKGRRGTA
jgi:hypothetical protein